MTARQRVDNQTTVSTLHVRTYNRVKRQSRRGGYQNSITCRGHLDKSRQSVSRPSPKAKNDNEQILKKADQALHEQSIEDREFISFTVAFNRKDLQEAKEAIRDFQKSFANRFYDKKQKKNSVYQLSVQFFRMDNSGGE